MQWFDLALSTAIILCALVAPVAIALTCRRETMGVFYATCLGVALCFVYCWWADAKIDLELYLLGYDANGMTVEERVRKVPAARRDYAEDLRAANMGIGWPLKAILSSFLVVPYALVAFAITRGLRRITQSESR